MNRLLKCLLLRRFRLLSAGLLIFLAGGGAVQAAKLDPGAWKIYRLNTTNVLTNLTDNNPATLVTLTNSGINSLGLFIDMGQTNVVGRLFLIGGNHTNLNQWPNGQNATNLPLGLIVVSVGNNPGSMTSQVGTWTVPYDAGNPVDTEVDLRFSPAAGRYVQIQLQTNVTWGANYWPGAAQSYILSGQPPPPSNLTWNVGEVELYGFNGTFTNLNAVVCDSTNVSNFTNQPLQIAALDLSYYLGELAGTPHPIITSSQTNLYPGRIYRIVDLASLAPDYNTMMANIASGALPTNLVVSAIGREVQFSGWPYRCVLWGVWEFLERQGVRWVYPDGHGDFVPTGSGVSLNMLPLQVRPSAISIYANFNCSSLQPWPPWDLQSVRQEYLYPWRNRWNYSWNGYGPLGGAEIPAMPALGMTYIQSNYTEGFGLFPHTFNSVVPARVLEIPQSPYTNWWGWTTTNAGSQVNPTNNPYGNQPTFTMDDPTLISWVASKITNWAAAKPLASSYPLNIADRCMAYNLMPMDSSTFSQDPFTIASNQPPQLNPVAWATMYGPGYCYSGAYYSFVNAVASQVQQKGCNVLVGALAYADVFPPPANITVFPTNVWVEVCQWGAPNLLMSDPANAGMKAAEDSWHSRCSHLATYDYALLHTDYWEQDPRLPVPLVAGTVDRAQYLASIGALDGGCQANLTSLPYNPWNFYAYPRIRWNTNQTASQLETEFFNGYFREAAAPMLAYYQGLENYQVTNGINMHYKGYAYGILPGAFPLSVLYEMQTNLTAAQQLATNWYVIDRVNDMTNEFNWLITNAGLHGINLTNIASYPVLSSTTNLFTIALTNMAAKFPGYMPYENAVWNWPTPNCWFMQPWAQIQDTFNVTNAGIYTVAVTAIGAEAYNAWPVMEVCLGPGNGSALVNTTNYSTYNFTFTIPAGVWDLEIICPTGEGNFTISNIQIVFIGSPPPATSPILLTDAAKLPNGAFQFAFTNTPVGTNYITTNITTTITTNWSKWGPPKITGYTTNTTTTLTTNGSANTATVLTTTNLLLPLTNWTVLGTVTDNPPGQFQFTDPQATNHPLRFYRVRSP